MVSGAYWMGYEVDRSNFVGVLVGYSVLFLGYATALRMGGSLSFRQIFWLAVLLRVMLLFAAPRLSEDVVRFVWDGWLTVEGENPYLSTPENAFECLSEKDQEMAQTLFESMNSPSYYTVYPPVKQYLFASAVSLGRGDPLSAMYILRLYLLLSDVLLIWALRQLLLFFNRFRHEVAVYALNPLVIVEVTGNFHFEGLVLTFLALAALAMIRGADRLTMHLRDAGVFWGGFFFAMAVLVKLTPLLLSPLIFISIRKWRHRLLFSVTAMATCVVAFVPFLSAELLHHWATSLNLYFQHFEFNASVYYVAREIGAAILGYNPIAFIGPSLAIVSITAILAVAFWFRLGKRQGITRFLLAIFLSHLFFLLLSTTVHPWYVVTLVAMAVFVRTRSVLVWSYTVTFSYVHYHGGAFSECYLLIMVSYLLPLIYFITFEKSGRRIAVL